jgi:hypothetical protein
LELPVNLRYQRWRRRFQLRHRLLKQLVQPRLLLDLLLASGTAGQVGLKGGPFRLGQPFTQEAIDQVAK